MSAELQALARATAVVHDPGVDPVWTDVRDTDLYDLVINKGLQLMLAARNSTSASRRGCVSAAEDLIGCAEELARVTGYDVRPYLPSIEQLAEWLFSSPYKIVSNDAEAGDFLNRFRIIRIPRANIIISISAGSAVKLDSTTLEQPHAEHVKRTLIDDELRLCGLFAKRFDRLTRDTWATGRIVEALKTLETRHGTVWGGDGEQGQWSLQEFSDLMFAVRGHGAGRDAKNMVSKRKFAMIQNTGKAMVENRVQFPFAQGCPPGTMRYRDRRTNTSWLTFDAPGFYPSTIEAEGLPEVRDDAGERVDQVENTIWLLARLGRPEFPLDDLIRQLVDRRFSSESLRLMRENGPAAHFGFTRATGTTHKVHASRLVETIDKHLDFYKTGVLHPSVNKTILTVSGIKPPGREWLTDEDHARIRSFAAQHRKPGRRPAGSWAGMPVTVNGAPGYMEGMDVDGERGWRLRVREAQERAEAGEDLLGDDASDDLAELADLADKRADRSEDPDADLDAEPLTSNEAGQSRLHRVPPIQDTTLVGAIVETVLAAGGRPLVPLLDTEAADSARRADVLRLKALESEINALEADLDHLEELLLARNKDGSEKLGPAMWDRTSTKVERETERLERLRSEATALAYTVRASGELLGLDAAAMTALVNGLRDPNVSRVRAVIRRAVKDLQFWSEAYQIHSQDGVRVRFRGQLVFKTLDGPQALPFDGMYERGAATLLDQRALEALARLRAGHVSRYVDSGLIRSMNGVVANLLGIPGEHFVMGNCADSNLLRVGMATLYPDAVVGEDPAGVPRLEDLAADPVLQEDFGDVMALAAAIQKAHGNAKRASWLVKPSPRGVSEAIIACAQDMAIWLDKWTGAGRSARRSSGAHRWTFSGRDSVGFSACRHCGNRLCAPMRLGEVTGYVCLNVECRRDDAGVRWDPRFDMYIEHVDLWIAAGAALTVDAGFELRPQELAGKVESPLCTPRTWKRVRPEVADAAVSDYVSTLVPVKQIARDHGISIGSVYGALRARGIPLRGCDSPAS